MKKAIQKIVTLLLVVATLISTSAVVTLPVAATSRTVSDAMNWCESQVGKALDYDGNYGAQCVDFIYYYYQYLGVSPVGGNGNDYAYNTLPSGWTRLQGATPQPGDILVYANNGANHVGIYASPSLMYHQAPSLGGYVLRDAHNYTYYNGYWGVVRPNFSDAQSSSVLTISGVNYPIQKASGGTFEVFGTISSPYLIELGEALVYDANGTYMFGIGTYTENGRYTYNLNEFDSGMRFASLADGQYRYFVQARDARGYYAYFETYFTVGGSGTTSAYAPTAVAVHSCDSVSDPQYTWDSGTVTKEPTCTEIGIRTYTCRECGATREESLPATGHSFGDWVTIQSPTFHVDGECRRTCTVCAFYESLRLPKLSESHTHSFAGKEEIVTPATCTATGSKKVYCVAEECGEYTLVALPKIDHIAGEWQITENATCQKNGTKVKKCTMCEAVMETVELIKLDHEMTETVVAPTTTERGYTLHKCKNCDYQYMSDFVDPIPDEDATKIIVETKKARAGKTVSVNVTLQNNPGIWGLDLSVEYDKTKLTLNSVTNGTVFSDAEWVKGNLAGSKYILSYEASGFENVTANGVLATLEFTVNEDAAADDFYAITVSYKAGDMIDVSFNEINAAVISGGVRVIDIIYGDLNGDGLVNKKDALLLKMYLADNSTEIDLEAADVFADGVVNKKDSLYLRQYLAGFDIELGA